MNPTYIDKNTRAGEDRVEVYDAPFGAVKGHGHFEHAWAVGSDIPGGTFVVYSPEYHMGSCSEREVMLPDLSGELLVHEDQVKVFADQIPGILKDGMFKIVGLATYAGDTCKDMCAVKKCCPYRYDGVQHDNYWPRYGTSQSRNVKILTQGVGKANNLTDIGLNDDLHITVAFLNDEEGNPVCRYFAVTNTPDEGTQPLNIDYRIVKPAAAGEGVWLELGRM